MSDEEIEAMAARLEAAARIEDAKFRMDERIDGEGSTTEPLIANRDGFLLLAAALLRGATAKEDVLTVLPPPFDAQYHELIFDKLIRREDWTTTDSTSYKSSWSDTFWMCGCTSLGLIFIGIFMIGLVAVYR